jgi:trehalose-6-phosphate synthase
LLRYLIWPAVTQQHVHALYCVADVFVVTPIRDGMNTLPFEYVIAA